MQYRRLGRTNLMVSAVGFGGIVLPEASRMEAIEAVRRALDLGMNFIDTARAYGDSEEKIGKAIEGRRDECILATKTAAREPGAARREIEESLRKLQTDKIELYQIHAVNNEEIYEGVMRPDSILDVLKGAREEGKIDYIGISMHSRPETMVKVIKSGEFDTIQVVYNLITRSFEIEDIPQTKEQVFPVAVEYDVGVIIMKPLAGGVLLGPSSAELKFLLKDKVRTTPVAALKFVLANPEVSTVIPGMKSVAEVEEDVVAGEAIEELTEEECQVMIEEAARLGKDFCRGCRYCMPCPQNINIADILRFEGYYTRYGLRDWAKKQYRRLSVKPDECADCGECEEKCPFNLPIREMLKRAQAVLEG